jgi:ferric-dicitrate binding protein FerR (iron transport regulator)
LIVALADGSLTGRRLERAERRMAAIPHAAEQIARQHRVTRALHGGPATPPTLAAAPTALRAPRHRVFRAPLAAATAVAAVLAALLLVGGQGGSTITQAAGLAKLDAERPAPAAAGPVLRESLAGVTFPE